MRSSLIQDVITKIENSTVKFCDTTHISIGFRIGEPSRNMYYVGNKKVASPIVFKSGNNSEKTWLVLKILNLS